MEIINMVKVFEENEIIIEIINGEPMFEIYSTGMALGYGRMKEVKGKLYPEIQKQRIEQNLKNGEIARLAHGVETFIDIKGLKKLISMSNTKNKIKFIDWLKENNYIAHDEVFLFTRKEDIFIDSLEAVLKPMGYTLERQKIGGKYRFDGYIQELDMVIEYDEDGHLHYDLDKECEREQYIKNNYSHIVRVTTFSDLMTNIGIVMNKIMEVA